MMVSAWVRMKGRICIATTVAPPPAGRIARRSGIASPKIARASGAGSPARPMRPRRRRATVERTVPSLPEEIQMTSMTASRPALAARIPWRAAGATAAAAVLFPRINAVLYDHERIYQVDREAAVLIPIIVVLTLALFAAVCARALRPSPKPNRPARAGPVVGILCVPAIAMFWLSLPIVLGGLALTLGVEGVDRAEAEGQRHCALAAVVLGSIGVVAGAVLWLA